MRNLESFVTASLGLMLTACAAPPTTLGVTDGRLAPCPDKPNCVSSQAPDPGHSIEPIRYAIALPEAMTRTREVIDAQPRTRIVTARADYLHAEFTSLIFRFVDDLELYFDDRNKLIHVRSASRLGRRDFGVNRKRVEHLRAELAPRLQAR